MVNLGLIMLNQGLKNKDLFYDIGKWNYPCIDHIIEKIEDLKTDNLFNFDAIHRIFLNSSMSIDLCIMGSQHYLNNNSILVCFSGAVTGDRHSKPAPIFSGYTVSQDLKLPLISISDPTIALSKDILLGWYAGNKDFPNLVQIIADLIDLISIRFEKKPILFGGSGGGFASLAVAQYTSKPVDVCVANPQTSIKDYAKEHVSRYLLTAYNIDTNKFNKYLTGDGEIEASLEQYVLHHDVKRGRLNNKSKIIYLQNDSDWHTEKHAIPFLNKNMMRKIGNRTFLSKDEKIAFYLGDWGDGHAAVPKEILYETLAHLDNNNSIDSILKKLDEFNLSAPSSNQVKEIVKSNESIINIDDGNDIDVSLNKSIRFTRNSASGERNFNIELLLASDENVGSNELLYSVEKFNGISNEDMIKLGYIKSSSNEIGYFRYIQTKPYEVYKVRTNFIIPDGYDTVCIKIMNFYPKGKTVIMSAKLSS